LTIEEASGPPVGVWPDNAPTIAVFIAMSTQWRVGMAGATGLDYNALPVVMRMHGIPAADRSVVFEGIREMEDAALGKMYESK
jgi:hypothetical protein